jgi:hypothetical protein
MLGEATSWKPVPHFSGKSAKKVIIESREDAVIKDKRD